LLIAYIGPGLAAGSIATILGLFAGVLCWPLPSFGIR
jgi:hypothetical protein